MMPWSKWEDWLNGFYDTEYTDDNVTDSASLLADPDRFGETAREMFREWPMATIHNLRHMWSGRNAWVGQASCLYAHDAPALATRQAWGTLTAEQQNEANRVATRCREEWEVDQYGRQTLPGL